MVCAYWTLSRNCFSDEHKSLTICKRLSSSENGKKKKNKLKKLLKR